LDVHGKSWEPGDFEAKTGWGSPEGNSMSLILGSQTGILKSKRDVMEICKPRVDATEILCQQQFTDIRRSDANGNFV